MKLLLLVLLLLVQAPIENVKEEAKKQAMIEAGVWNEELRRIKYKKGIKLLYWYS